MGCSGILADLRPPLDADYVRAFQRLADLNLEIRRLGRTPARLLRKAVLESAVGNLHASRDSAEEAVLRAPESAEARYNLGVASLLVAYAEAGALECMPRADEHPPVRSLVHDALAALSAACERNPDDGEAHHLRRHVEHLLTTCRTDLDVLGHLRAERVPARPPRPQPRR